MKKPASFQSFGYLSNQYLDDVVKLFKILIDLIIMKSINLIVVLIVLFIILSSYYFFVFDKNQHQDAGRIILRVGERKQFNNLSIRMVRIKEDSRCPINVKCVWAGKVSADVELSRGEFVEIIETTLNIGSSPYMFEGYLIKFVDIKPEKIVGQKINQSEYSATFSIDSA